MRNMNHDVFKSRRRLSSPRKRVRPHDVSSSNNITSNKIQQDPRYSNIGYDIPNDKHQSSNEQSAQSEHSSTQQLSTSLIKPKLINGNRIPSNNHPYLARLYKFDPINRPYLFRRRDPFYLLQKRDSYYHCGGSLISPNVVLTAAHCIDDDFNHLDIQDATESGKVTSYTIQQVAIHPKFQEGHFGHDFALLKIDSNHLEVIENVGIDGRSYWSLRRNDGGIDWSRPPIMRLHRYGHETGEHNNSCENLRNEESARDITKLSVLGYYTTSNYSNTNSKSKTNKANSGFDDIQMADLHYLTNDECNIMYLSAPLSALSMTEVDSNNRIITDDMMCAMDAVEGQDACSGDSGNPLLAMLPPSSSSSLSTLPKLLTQVGIVSWGLGCARSNSPGVYSRIAEELDWIEYAICNGRNGLSPLSCVFDGGSKRRRLSDHALEAITMKQNSDNGAVVNDSISVGSDALDAEWSVQNEEHSESTNRLDTIAQNVEKLSVTVDEACELLEGPFLHNYQGDKASSQENNIDQENISLIPGSNDESNFPLIIFGLDDGQKIHQPIETPNTSEKHIIQTPVSGEHLSFLTTNDAKEVQSTVESVSNDEDMSLVLENINSKPSHKTGNGDTPAVATPHASTGHMDEYNEGFEYPSTINTEHTPTNIICQLVGNIDATYFFVDDMRVRNCEWVLEKKWERCSMYRKCCPESCHGSN